MKYLHKAFGLLFSLFNLYILIAIVAIYFGYQLYLIPFETIFYLLVAYFSLLVVESYLDSEKKIYPILFLIMIGVILLFKQYIMINIFFLIVYSYMYSKRSPLAVPLSFITLGYFAMNFILLLGYALVTYGWITYFLKKTTSEN